MSPPCTTSVCEGPGQRSPRGCPEAPAGGALVGGAVRQGDRLEDVPAGGADAGGLGHDGAWTAARRPGPRAGKDTSRGGP